MHLYFLFVYGLLLCMYMINSFGKKLYFEFSLKVPLFFVRVCTEKFSWLFYNNARMWEYINVIIYDKHIHEIVKCRRFKHQATSFFCLSLCSVNLMPYIYYCFGHTMYNPTFELVFFNK